MTTEKELLRTLMIPERELLILRYFLAIIDVNVSNEIEAELEQDNYIKLKTAKELGRNIFAKNSSLFKTINKEQYILTPEGEEKYNDLYIKKVEKLMCEDLDKFLKSRNS